MTAICETVQSSGNGIYVAHSSGENKIALSYPNKPLKRIFDIFFSVLCLLFLSPLILYLALHVFLTTDGPVIYRQQRLGLNGKFFWILKFRSMIKDAEADTPMLSFKDDPRVTPIGKFLRRYHLDELPQLWNILKGDMSFVGPRPERAYYADILQRQNISYKRLITVKPGLTSWAMVKYGYAENTEQMLMRLHYDLYYINNCSLLFDISIIGKTARVLMRKEGL